MDVAYMDVAYTDVAYMDVAYIYIYIQKFPEFPVF